METRQYLLVIVAACTLASGGPVTAAVFQELNRDNFSASICNIASMGVSFNIDEAYGEPLVASKMRWTAGPNTNVDCLSKVTHVWIRVRTETDSLRYFRLRPKVLPAGQNFGATATESPSWSNLFCNNPTDSAACEPESISRQLFSSSLRFEGFEVVTKGSVSSPRRPKTRPGTEDGGFSLDSMLSAAIDNAIDPDTSSQAAEEELEIKKSQLTPEQVAAQIAARKEDQAKKATSNVLALISSPLAQYTSPAHDCESARTIANWVQAPGMCQFNFGSESSHDYLCADNGKARSIRATRRARINLAEDIAEIAEIRHSSDGWASLVLVLNTDLQSTTDGDYKTNRWQITADESRLGDLEQLAVNLMTLVDFCEPG
ncbi:MAG: hypothetical protein O6945_09965 [Gammaproteobacteria bacterium]|nr:hypothetical protein [Gammaproteobacteria bacterium]